MKSRIKTITIIALIMAAFNHSGYCQEDLNIIANKTKGYQFNKPDGWKHQKLQNGNHLFGHDKIAGLVAVIEHNYTDIEEVKSIVMLEGIEEEGMLLEPIGSIESYGKIGLQGNFEGYFDDTLVKATVISLFSPHGGGLTIFAITSKEKYNAEYKELAQNLASSVVFKKPVESDLVKQWKTFLNNRKLTYYNTTDDVAEKMVFILYDNGWFVFHDESFYGSKDEYTDKTQYFSSLTTNKNAGKWRVTGNDNNATLELNYNNGGFTAKSLQMKEGSQSQVLVNGKRFFSEPVN